MSKVSKFTNAKSFHAALFAALNARNEAHPCADHWAVINPKGKLFFDVPAAQAMIDCGFGTSATIDAVSATKAKSGGEMQHVINQKALKRIIRNFRAIGNNNVGYVARADAAFIAGADTLGAISSDTLGFVLAKGEATESVLAELNGQSLRRYRTGYTVGTAGSMKSSTQIALSFMNVMQKDPQTGKRVLIADSPVTKAMLRVMGRATEEQREEMTND